MSIDGKQQKELDRAVGLLLKMGSVPEDARTRKPPNKDRHRRWALRTIGGKPKIVEKPINTDT